MSEKDTKREIVELQKLVEDKKLQARLEKTKSNLERYDVVRRELASAELALKLLKDKRGNLSNAVEKIETHKDRLSKHVQDKEVEIARLDKEIENRKKETEKPLAEAKKAKEEKKFAEQETEKEKKRQNKNLRAFQNTKSKLESDISQFEEKKASLNTEVINVKKIIGQLRGQESIYRNKVKRAEERLTEVRQYIDNAQIELARLNEEKYAIKENHDKYERDLATEEDKTIQEMDKRKKELDEKEEYLKRWEQIISGKAKELREVKRKLEQYLGKPIRMNI